MVVFSHVSVAFIDLFEDISAGLPTVKYVCYHFYKSDKVLNSEFHMAVKHFLWIKKTSHNKLEYYQKERTPYFNVPCAF